MMRRNDLKIQVDLLEIARPGSRKTRLVYQGNLNFNVISPYLKKMMDLGLMKVVDGIYYTTDKGRKFIEAFKNLMLFQVFEVK